MKPHELKTWRAEIGVSQARLARELGITTRTLQNYEAGQTRISPLLPKALRGIRQALRGKLVREARCGEREQWRANCLALQEIERMLRGRRLRVPKL